MFTRLVLLKRDWRSNTSQIVNFEVVFNADLQPDEDLLWNTIPDMLEDQELGLVQARRKFGKTVGMTCSESKFKNHYR